MGHAQKCIPVIQITNAKAIWKNRAETHFSPLSIALFCTLKGSRKGKLIP
jgi:hypothetical protein